MHVDVNKIKDNPLNVEVYGAIVPSDIDTLIESINQLGLLQPLIITKNNTLISGHRRLACLRKLKIKKAECIVKDIEDEEAIVFIIESNRQRVKTARQQLNEATYLFEYYGRNQGKRNDLTTCGEYPQEVGTKTRDKVADEIGTSTNTISRLMYIEEHYPTLIDVIGKEITLNQAFKEVRQIVGKDKLSKAGKTYKKNGNIKKVQTDSYVIYNQSSEEMNQVADSSVQFIFSSPPYHLIRDYGVPGCIGDDASLDLYLDRMMKVMEECWRVMRDDATMFLVYGDKYQNGSMLMSPERLIVRMLDYGFKLKNKIIWKKGNPNPEACQRRFMQNNEVIYFLTKTNNYKINMDCFRIPHRDKNPVSNAPKHHRLVTDTRIAHKSASLKNPLGKVPSSVEVLEDFVITSQRKKQRKNGTEPYELHNSTFPVELVDRFAEACLDHKDLALDMFCGSGTTLESIVKHGGYAVGYELQPLYIEYCKERLSALEV